MTALRTRLARAICVALGDNWECKTPDDPIEIYGAAADAVLAVLAAPSDADVERVVLAIQANYHKSDAEIAREAIRALVGEVSP